VLELDPSDHLSWYSEAVLHLQFGDEAGYRRACREMLARFGQAKEDFIAERTAKTCLLAPGAVADLAPVVRLAEQAVAIGTKGKEYAGSVALGPQIVVGAVATGENKEYRWFLLARGMADYRTGGYTAALDRLRDCLKPGAEDLYRDTTVHLFLAMTHHRLKQPKEALAELEKARALMDEKFPKPEREGLASNWGDWLRCQLFRREAEALLRGKAADEGE
jgi:hypothetical protein